MTTLVQDFQEFAATSKGHFIVSLVTTFVAAGVSALLKDASVAAWIAGIGSIGSVRALVVDILDGTVTN